MRSPPLGNGLRDDAKPAMVCSADDLRGWTDFPKGLRVLLLNEDTTSAAEIKSKLEEMDYIVSTFGDEEEALQAILDRGESFHVAIVEVNIENTERSFKFLEMAKDIPTIMISSNHCLSTMMKCIALGAAEFLQKPLSDDKLRNIWQHVVHKAFNAGASVLSKSLKPIKETVASILQLETGNSEPENQNPSQTDNDVQAQELERYPAPSTPQLERGRLVDDGDCSEQVNCLTKTECKEKDGQPVEPRKVTCSESKSVDNTCNHSFGGVTVKDSPSRIEEALHDEEVDSGVGLKTDNCHKMEENVVSSNSPNSDNVEIAAENAHQKNLGSCGIKGNRKKLKVDWTPELHKRFVQAVEQLGIDQAIPSRILEVMKVEGLTRHNVASHLQKYRMHRRHIVPKEDDRKWPTHRDPLHRSFIHRPLMAYPPHHSNYGISTGQIYQVWGHPSCNPSSMPMWGNPGVAAWQPAESWHWKTYPAMHADAWGCPVIPPQVPCTTIPQNGVRSHASNLVQAGKELPQNSLDLHPAEEVIDKVVKEVISQPWLPLPLGLKPPSTESVLTELHRQGIPNVPSPHPPPPLTQKKTRNRIAQIKRGGGKIEKEPQTGLKKLSSAVSITSKRMRRGPFPGVGGSFCPRNAHGQMGLVLFGHLVKRVCVATLWVLRHGSVSVAEKRRKKGRVEGPLRSKVVEFRAVLDVFGCLGGDSSAAVERPDMYRISARSLRALRQSRARSGEARWILCHCPVRTEGEEIERL
ncbi:hypothetical protein H6P81_005133 [Aristolochia fimbriata]|uniref:Two-component response regulator-like APRR2 n=1 Tax=Aristolochia fimbriata TaxID=158543 RepID=A0AAV7EV06_ARIFI|nr:hypothetical protein H6P81_005133 [Aristolochia fimbriata]